MTHTSAQHCQTTSTLLRPVWGPSVPGTDKPMSSMESTLGWGLDNLSCQGDVMVQGLPSLEKRHFQENLIAASLQGGYEKTYEPFMITYSGRKRNNKHKLLYERQDIRINFSTLLTDKDWNK